MAYDSEKIFRMGRTGAASSGISEYQVEYLVTVTDPLDGPQIVLDGSPGQIGSTSWSIGNDSDSRSLLLRKNTVERMNPLLWKIRHEYGDPAKQEENTQEDEQGQETTDPLLWRDQFQPLTHSINEPVDDEAWNVFLIPGAANRPADSRGAPQNSAGQLFLPPPYRDRDYRGWQVIQYFANNDEAGLAAYDFTLNDKPVRWSGWRNYNVFDMDTHTLLCRGCRISDEKINDVNVWVHRWEFHYNPNRWYTNFLDQGNTSSFILGAYNTRTNELITEEKIGAPNLQVPMDQNGEPVNRTINLDGQGEPLKKDQLPVMLPYRLHEAAALEGTPIANLIAQV